MQQRGLSKSGCEGSLVPVVTSKEVGAWLLGGSGGFSKWVNNPYNPYSNPSYPPF